MPAKAIPYDKQLELIIECRQSGLTDSQWCIEHDINPGTFYNWVKRHRKNACPDIPEAGSGRKASAVPQKQEVVRIYPAQLSPAVEKNEPFVFDKHTITCMENLVPQLEITIDNVLLRVTNDVKLVLIIQEYFICVKLFDII